MIKAIFYSKFDTQGGPKVIHQVPDGAIVPSSTAPQQQLFLNFSDISFFVIPRQELCGTLLQVCNNGYRILGYPVCIKSPKYDRNEFIFNFCLVLSEDEDFSTYKSVVRKLADLMMGLEEQSAFLSKDFSKSGEGKVYSLCEMLMEDLNNYCECMIPIDEINTLNIKLFPTYPPPPPVKAWQVPLFTVRWESFIDENWDLTIQRIIPFINGINSVHKISILADSDFSLTRRAIKHLLYYGCLLLLDIFSFSAIYAVTAQFGSTIVADTDMQRECARYVNLAFAPTTISATTVTANNNISASGGTGGGGATSLLTDPSRVGLGDDVWPLTSTGQPVDGVTIIELYAALKQGQSVKQWYIEHADKLVNIDVRRFITFGIIKGFLYRVHKYALVSETPAQGQGQGHNSPGGIHRSKRQQQGQQQQILSTSDTSKPTPTLRDRDRDRGRHNHHNINSPATTNPTSKTHSLLSLPTSPAPTLSSRSTSSSSRSSSLSSTSSNTSDSAAAAAIDDKVLLKYLDGTHCFDQICTELEICERALVGTVMRRWRGEVVLIHR